MIKYELLAFNSEAQFTLRLQQKQHKQTTNGSYYIREGHLSQFSFEIKQMTEGELSGEPTIWCKFYCSQLAYIFYNFHELNVSTSHKIPNKDQ